MDLRPEDFISLARHDLRQNNSEPSQVALRRSLSTVYYAMFHTLAKNGADLLVGTTDVSRSIHAWRQTYRGLEHGRVKSACRKLGVMEKFPPSIQKFGDFFVEMQKVRHSADYDPYAEFEEPLTKFFVERRINRAEKIIGDFNAAHKKDRKAFAVYVLFKIRDFG